MSVRNRVELVASLQSIHNGISSVVQKTIKLKLLMTLVVLMSTSCGVFSGRDEGDPAALVRFDEEVSLERVWRVRVGKGQGELYNRLQPVIEGDVIYVASADGIVMALDKESGQRKWRVKLDYSISGGVGIGGGAVLLGSESSQVLALDQLSGEVLWESKVSSEVLSTPVTNGNVVVVQSIDGNLTGLDAASGEQIWIYESPVPALSLRGTSSPLVFQDYVIAGFANGTVLSIAMDNGTLRWEQRVAIPTGRSEIDRLIDIDGSIFMDESGILLASSYQGYLAAIEAVTGAVRWRTKGSSIVGVGSGFGNLYFNDEEGNVIAYRLGEEDAVWVNEQMTLRQLSSPAGFNNYVAVADFEGYLHLLSQIDGHMMGRIKIDKKGVRADMISQNNTLYVYGNSGKLVALRVR